MNWQGLQPIKMQISINSKKKKATKNKSWNSKASKCELRYSEGIQYVQLIPFLEIFTLTGFDIPKYLLDVLDFFCFSGKRKNNNCLFFFCSSKCFLPNLLFVLKRFPTSWWWLKREPSRIRHQLRRASSASFAFSGRISNRYVLISLHLVKFIMLFRFKYLQQYCLYFYAAPVRVLVFCQLKPACCCSFFIKTVSFFFDLPTRKSILEPAQKQTSTQAPWRWRVRRTKMPVTHPSRRSRWFWRCWALDIGISHWWVSTNPKSEKLLVWNKDTANSGSLRPDRCSCGL